MKYERIYSINVLLFLLTLSFQGCFVVGIANSPTWQSNQEVKQNVQVRVNLNRQTVNVSIPFFLLEFDKKGYGVTVYIDTKENIYTNIDSVSYEIYDSIGGLITQGICNKTSMRFRKLGVDTSSFYYQGWAESPFSIKIPQVRQRGNLMINYKLYMQDQILNGNSHLQIKRKSFWISFFYG